MLALLEALQDRAVRDRAGARGAARRRRPHAAPRRRLAARARHPGRGRARPRRQLPAAAGLPRPAADVHDRRGGRRRARADGRAAARPGDRRRAGEGPPRAARPRPAAVESLEHTLGFTGSVDAAPPDGETLLALADAAAPRPPRDARATRTRAAPRPRASSARTASSPTAGAGTCRRSTTRAGSCARCARTAWRRCGSAGAASRRRAEFDAVAFVSRMLARVPWAHEVEVVLHTDFETRRAALPADARGARAARRTACSCGSARSRWTGRQGCWLVPGARSRSLRPEALRARLAALASRLTAA